MIQSCSTIGHHALTMVRPWRPRIVSQRGRNGRILLIYDDQWWNMMTNGGAWLNPVQQRYSRHYKGLLMQENREIVNNARSCSQGLGRDVESSDFGDDVPKMTRIHLLWYNILGTRWGKLRASQTILQMIGVDKSFILYNNWQHLICFVSAECWLLILSGVRE